MQIFFLISFIPKLFKCVSLMKAALCSLKKGCIILSIMSKASEYSVNMPYQIAVNHGKNHHYCP